MREVLLVEELLSSQEGHGVSSGTIKYDIQTTAVNVVHTYADFLV